MPRRPALRKRAADEEGFRNSSLSPDGVCGEIYVGGEGLARGYLNRFEQTVSGFIRHPFSDRASDRLYRTGDLARRFPGGDIEYVGRTDDQVKIRGFRIELGKSKQH
jgi:non-ribosomal peptide synthetase component F